MDANVQTSQFVPKCGSGLRENHSIIRATRAAAEGDRMDAAGSIVIRKAVREDLPRMQEIFALAQYDSIRIDTHRDNSVMRNALLREGYRYCGIIHC